MFQTLTCHGSHVCICCGGGWPLALSECVWANQASHSIGSEGSMLSTLTSFEMGFMLLDVMLPSGCEVTLVHSQITLGRGGYAS